MERAIAQLDFEAGIERVVQVQADTRCSFNSYAAPWCNKR